MRADIWWSAGQLESLQPEYRNLDGYVLRLIHNLPFLFFCFVWLDVTWCTKNYFPEIFSYFVMTATQHQGPATVLLMAHTWRFPAIEVGESIGKKKNNNTISQTIRLKCTPTHKHAHTRVQSVFYRRLINHPRWEVKVVASTGCKLEHFSTLKVKLISI